MHARLGIQRSFENHVLEFANVSRPWVLSERFEGILAEVRGGTVLFQKMIGQRVNVLCPLAERWYMQLKLSEPVIEIAAETARGDLYHRLTQFQMHVQIGRAH